MTRPKYPLLALPFLALALAAAGPPQRGFSLQVPAAPGSTLPVPPVPPAPTSLFAPAPLPNRDMEFPNAPRSSNATTVAPSLFTRGDQYRGEGFAKGSTAQTAQEQRARPGAGISLKMPLTGN